MGRDGSTEHLGVIAESYKLNVCPSLLMIVGWVLRFLLTLVSTNHRYIPALAGKFRAHVDTPSGANQFGSLIVCLPHPHQDSQLRVAHNGDERVWDWSNETATEVGWVAFYSDCKHELLQVKAASDHFDVQPVCS